MQFVLFSKHWKELDIEGMVERTLEIGADGVDLAVRPGFVVNPDNVRTELAPAVAKFRAAGLDVPMISTDAGFISPDDPVAESTAAALQEAGVRYGKLGYWRWRDGETPYWEQVAKIRHDLEGFEALGRRYGVTFCYHTHSDYFGLNAAAMMDLLEGRDPQHMGAYLDTGHLHYCGEPYPMAIDIVGRYLTLVSFKDTSFKRVNDEAEELPEWKRVIVPAGYGVVKWQSVFGGLIKAGYDGVCSCHCEFAASSPEEFLHLQKREVAYLRNQHAQAQTRAAAASTQ